MANMNSGENPLSSTYRGGEFVQNENQFRNSQFNPQMTGSGFKGSAGYRPSQRYATPERGMPLQEVNHNQAMGQQF